MFEVAVTNETLEKLLDDADQKHFSSITSISVWCGIKVKLSSRRGDETFWCGWGRRKAIGYGLKLEEQTEDDAGMATFLPVHLDENAILNGALTIPSDLIFYPLPPPADATEALLIPFEDVRKWIIAGLEFLYGG